MEQISRAYVALRRWGRREGAPCRGQGVERQRTVGVGVIGSVSGEAAQRLDGAVPIARTSREFHGVLAVAKQRVGRW
jgi:hypothetical protein